jgi:hypothetical protein
MEGASEKVFVYFECLCCVLRVLCFENTKEGRGVS